MKENSSPFHRGLTRGVYNPVSRLRAVNHYPNIASPSPVVDHYRVRARASPPFPTFPIASSPPRTPFGTLPPSGRRLVSTLQPSASARQHGASRLVSTLGLAPSLISRSYRGFVDGSASGFRARGGSPQAV